MGKKDSDMNRFDARLSAVYRHREDKRQHYDDWAASYDADLVCDLDYVAYRDAGNIFAACVADRDCRVLDVACGTGLAGAYLSELGYRHLDGADFSAGMLALAQKRGCYESLWQHDFTTPRQPKRAYDALICVGLFAFASPGISDLHHVVDCVKPGGNCIVTVNGAAWRQLKLESEVYRVAEKHAFSIDDIVEAGYIRQQDIDSRVLLIRR